MSNSSDPSGFVSNPPSHYVKIQNTSQQQLNGKFGLVIGYNTERGRYMLLFCHNGQQAMLKAENLVRVSMVEKYQAQFQQLRNDPRVKQELGRLYARAQQLLGGTKPEYAAGGIGILLLLLIVTVGFTRMMLITSMVLLLGIIVAPDVLANVMNTNNRNWKIVATNFPRRCRETIERNLPAARGKVTDKMAAGIVLIVVFISLRSLFASSPSASPYSSSSSLPPRTATPNLVTPSSLLEEAYKLGFEDASENKPFGSSSLEALLQSASSSSSSSIDDIDYDYIAPSNGGNNNNNKGGGFGIGTLMSVVMVGRTLMQLGTNPAGGGGFDFQLAMANFQNLPVWQQGLMGLSFYRILRAFM